MPLFTSRQPLPDLRITPQKWTPDPELSLKHDGLYASAWECEDEKPIFDGEKNNITPPNSPEIAVQSDSRGNVEHTRNRQVCSREMFPPTEDLCDVTYTYPYLEPDAETSSEQPNNSPTNPRSSKYTLRHNPKPNCNDDYGYYFLRCTSMFHGTRT